MNYALLIACLCTMLGHAAPIVSSEYFGRRSDGYFDHPAPERMHFEDNDKTAQKFLYITNLIEHGLTFTQAQDAFKKRLSVQSALLPEDAENLETVESYLKNGRHSPSSRNFYFRNERDQTTFYIAITKYLRLELDFAKASLADGHSLTPEQALLMKQRLIECNGPHNNNGSDEIIARIKLETSSSRT